MRTCLIILIFSCLAFYGFAGIHNITKIDQLSADSVYDGVPCISDNELAICILRIFNLSDPTTDMFMEATRASTSDPWMSPTTDPFVYVMSNSGETSPWVSNDGLRLYFDSDRDGQYDIYFSSRTTTVDRFSTPTKIVSISQDGCRDMYARLANNELTIYFLSDRHSPGSVTRIYRANRPNLSSDFGTPTLLSEISDDYWLFDVSNDELKMVLGPTLPPWYFYYYSERSSTSDPFSAPQLLEDFPSSDLVGGGTLNGDSSRVYFALAVGSSDPMDLDLYCGDVVFGPPATPTPTPTPWPLPEISMAANRDQIASFTGNVANPWAAAFDSQDRFIFFDQKAVVFPVGLTGTNQLIRMTVSDSTPSFTTLATQSQLAAVDSRWGDPDPFNMTYIAGVDVLSDDSVVLIGAGPDPQKLLRVVPGTPPAVTCIANFDIDYWEYVEALSVDRSVTPNIVYIATDSQILSVTADQLNATPSLWYTYDYTTIGDIAVDINGDVLLLDFVRGNIYRVDKVTRTKTPLLATSLYYSLTHYTGNCTFAVNPTNGEIIGVYVSHGYPSPYYYYNVYRITHDGGGTYTAKDYVMELQIFADSDISSWVSPDNSFAPLGNGMAISPSGSVVFASLGTTPQDLTGGQYYGMNCIVSIGATVRTKVNQYLWMQYK